MKPGAWLALGACLGAVVGAVVGLSLSRGATSGSDWPDKAAEHNLPNRRAYALPLNNPDMIPVAAATHVRDDDVVIGILVRGQARAYPWWLASNYHVVNDTVDDEPVLVTLCEVCGGAAAYRPSLAELPGIPLSFQLSGVGLGTIVISDQQTWSKWRPFLGVAFEGPLKGRTLDRLPVLLMSWREWRQLYPAGLVANGSPSLRQRLHGTESGRIGDPDLPPPFDRSANLADQRLPAHELVIGIQRPDTGRSYAVPVRLLMPYPGLFRGMAGDKPVLLVRQSELAIAAFDLAATAYRDPPVLASTFPLQFRTSDGLTWDAFGTARAADAREVKLPAACGYLTEWYEWVSHSPDSALIERVEPWSAEASAAGAK